MKFSAAHVANATAATIKGIDLDITALPVYRVTLSASFEVLDGHYTCFKNGQYFVYNPATGDNGVFVQVRANAPLPCGNVLPPRTYLLAVSLYF